MEAFQLPTPAGRRFAVLHTPSGRPRGAILFAPPFAEEMNKSRRMAARQARAFAAAGFAVLLVDLLGTGDSPGDFSDATWSAWVSDLEGAHDWLSARAAGPFWFWGLRAGCLLANCVRTKDLCGGGYVFWQPVISGRTYLQHFLRTKVAGERTTGGTGTTVRSLREAIAAGSALEIAGYTVSPGLATGLEQAELIAPPSGARSIWFEVGASESLAPVSEQRVGGWREIGCEVVTETVRGPQFWQTQEITECPELIDRTVAACLQ